MHAQVPPTDAQSKPAARSPKAVGFGIAEMVISLPLILGALMFGAVAVLTDWPLWISFAGRSSE